MDTAADGKLVLSKPEAASALGISPRMIDRFLESGRLKPVRIGRRVLIPRKQIEAIAEGVDVPQAGGGSDDK